MRPPLQPVAPLPSPVPVGPWVVAAQATQIGPWTAYPTLVMLVAAAAAAPVWPWSRRWGWTIAGIFGVSAATAALFTGAWLLS